MTEALFSINNAGELISARYYTITKETLARKIITNELIDEILERCNYGQGKHWDFTFEDLRIEILKKYDHKIEFFVSRDILKGESSWQLPSDN
jgi:ferritin-like protein